MFRLNQSNYNFIYLINPKMLLVLLFFKFFYGVEPYDAVVILLSFRIFQRLRIQQHLLIQQSLSQTQHPIVEAMQKFNTPGEELRNQFMKVPLSRINHNDQQYMNKLIELGIQPNPNLYPAFFKLKNGLEYPGMTTKTTLRNNEILVKVPQNLILNSMIALNQPLLKKVFEQDFYKLQNCWEDRVLLTYCLFIISQKSPNNIFKQMIQHMSKDIDLAFNWNEEQLDIIMDKTVKSAAKLDKQSFDQQWQDFQNLQKKYSILQQPQFNKQNYLWIFVHITSRTFGKAMDYTSFVPFCQFFNHHSSSVYYQINLPKQKPSLKYQQQQEELSSNGSNESGQYLEEGQFAYDEIQPVAYKWGENQCFNLDKIQKNKIQDFANQLLTRIQVQVDWKDFSILFAGHFITRVKLIQNQYKEGRKGFEKTLSNLQILQKILDKYVQLIKAFYKTKYGKNYKYKSTTRDNFQQIPKEQFKRPAPQIYKPEYTQFYLKTGKIDNFEYNHEVYFCYGRNSNRILLLRYGFAIEGNKYEHVWLSYPLNGNLKQMPDLMVRIQKLGLSIRRKYKISHCSLNLGLIIFFRLNSWNLYGINSLDEIFFVMNINNELLILEQVCDSLASSLKMYQDITQTDLTNNKLNYHQYFATVYNLQKKRILQKQIQLISKLIEVLKRLAEGQNMEKACIILTEPQKYMCKYYLSTIVL